MNCSYRQAFTLVELSIVLVILGLLTGGILTGQSLIKAAELRSVITEIQRHQTALQSFNDQYMDIPGDMKTATQYWGDDNAACADAAVTNGTPGTCNGDGDGRIEDGGVINATGERFEYWRQLALAGLIEGSYTGLAGSLSVGDHLYGLNSPASKFPQGVWSVGYLGAQSGHAVVFNGNYDNIMILGIKDSVTGKIQNPLLKPEEMWNIDTKLDDGKPGRGKIIARYWDNLCATAATSADLDAPYKLTDNTAQCVLYVLGQYQ